MEASFSHYFEAIIYTFEIRSTLINKYCRSALINKYCLQERFYFHKCNVQSLSAILYSNKNAIFCCCCELRFRTYFIIANLYSNRFRQFVPLFDNLIAMGLLSQKCFTICRVIFYIYISMYVETYLIMQ